MSIRWMTVKELAGYLRVSDDLIYQMAQNGRIPASKIGAQWRFDGEEIDDWMRRQRPGLGRRIGQASRLEGTEPA